VEWEEVHWARRAGHAREWAAAAVVRFDIGGEWRSSGGEKLWRWE